MKRAVILSELFNRHIIKSFSLPLKNFVIIVLDGVGIGELPDAAIYNDQGSNTLVNIAKAVGGLELPNLSKMGLGNIEKIPGLIYQNSPLASFGKMNEASKGKDSTTGHWELSGLFVDLEFSYFPDGFPVEVLNRFLSYTGCKGFLGNKAASGTEIINELGDDHLKTGYPIIYTSADSVFQIAAHEEVISLKKLYEICEVTRIKVLTSPYHLGRVIARPFIGTSGNFIRTTNRKDYSLDPPGETILDLLFKNGLNTIAIGKINDLFNFRGIKSQVIAKSNRIVSEKIIEYLKGSKNSLIFANLVDFDVYFGHRNDPFGFYNALKEFDDILPGILTELDSNDALVITADHGNDPTTISTDHSREYVPLLFYSKNSPSKNLGTRNTFADVAKTVADFFGIKESLKGKSFLNE